MQRRTFIKNSCAICISAATFGFVQSLQGCTSSQLYRTEAVDRKVFVPLSYFAEKDVVVTRVKGETFDIAVVKRNENVFASYQLQCTHANNELIFSGNQFFCSLHGSTFGKDGQVTKGPAENKLKSYPAELIGDFVITHL